MLLFIFFTFLREDFLACHSQRLRISPEDFFVCSHLVTTGLSHRVRVFFCYREPIAEAITL